MQILVFQHAPTEGPGTLAEWALARGHALSVHHWYLEPSAPKSDSFDWLVVLGGAMNADQEQDYPWLKEEKAFLREWIESKKPYLGICLGSQLLARSLGAKVELNPDREIGFWEVYRNSASHPALRRWPERALVYQFHEDTFALPSGAELLLESPACPRQAYSLGDKVLALQFHPESSAEWIRGNASSIAPKGGEPWVQSAETTEAALPAALPPMTRLFFQLLDDFSEAFHAPSRP